MLHSLIVCSRARLKTRHCVASVATFDILDCSSILTEHGLSGMTRRLDRQVWKSENLGVGEKLGERVNWQDGFDGSTLVLV